MANGAVEVVRVEVSRSPATGLFSFAVVMSAPDDSGEFRVGVDEAALLCYRQFQAVMLMTCGWMFRLSSCEGKPSEAADEGWRAFVVSAMERVGPTAEGVAPMN